MSGPSEVEDSNPGLVTSQAVRLFEEGRSLIQDGNVVAACERFEASRAIVDGVGTQFNLADCYEKWGDRLKARELFIDVAKRTAEAGESQRSEVAKARAQAIEAGLARLIVRMTAPAPGQVTHLDQERFEASAGGEPHFLEPGKYIVRATAKGRKEWKKPLTLAAGPATLVIPELVRLKPKAAARVAEARPTPDTPTQSESWTWVTPTALGVGAVGVFAGLAYTQQYRASHEDAQAVCPSSRSCTVAEFALHQELVDDSRRARNRAYIGYSVAGIGTAVGLVHYLLTDSPKPDADWGDEEWGLAPLLGTEVAGGQLRGSF